MCRGQTLRQIVYNDSMGEVKKLLSRMDGLEKALATERYRRCNCTQSSGVDQEQLRHVNKKMDALSKELDKMMTDVDDELNSVFTSLHKVSPSNLCKLCYQAAVSLRNG